MWNEIAYLAAGTGCCVSVSGVEHEYAVINADVSLAESVECLINRGSCGLIICQESNVFCRKFKVYSKQIANCHCVTHRVRKWRRALVVVNSYDERITVCIKRFAKKSNIAHCHVLRVFGL